MRGKHLAPAGKPGGDEKGAPWANGKCRHHWMIESPTGPKSVGVCKRCGLRREFDNYIPVSSWGEDSSLPTQRRRSAALGSGDEKSVDSSD